MSEWSDEAVAEFWPAYCRAMLAGADGPNSVPAALTAADAVRKREVGEKMPTPAGRVWVSMNYPDPDGYGVGVCDDGTAWHVWRGHSGGPWIHGEIPPPSAPALEAARPVETSGYYEEVRATQELPPKPATERRCGTCRWFLGEDKDIDGPWSACDWRPSQPIPWAWGEPINDPKENDGTDCPTWEARNV